MIGAVALVVIAVIVAAVLVFGGSKTNNKPAARHSTAADYTLTVVFCGVDQSGFASMDGFLRNTSHDGLRFAFDVAFKDRSGRIVGDGLGETSLHAGEGAPISAGVQVGTTVTNVTCDFTLT